MRVFTTILLLLTASNLWAGEGRIYAQMVTASTGLASGSPIEIYTSTTGKTQSEPSVAFYDDRFLVVWNEWNTVTGDLDIKAARIEMDGTVLDSTPIDIDSTERNQSMPDVAADSSGWMVVWESFEDEYVTPSIMAQRVNYNGSTDSESRIRFGSYVYNGLSNTGSYPQIAWDGTNHLVVFTALSSTLGNQTHWSLLSDVPVATAKSTDTTAIYGNGQSDTYYPVAASPDGGWTIISQPGTANPWSQGAAYTTARSYGADGVKGTSGILDSTPDYYSGDSYLWEGSAVTADSVYNIVVWSRWTYGGGNDRTYYDCDLYAGRVENGNTLIESSGGTAVATEADVSKQYPSIAGDGAGNLLLAYEKYADGSTEIASNIMTVDGSGITVTEADEQILRTDSTGSRRSQIDTAYGSDEVSPNVFLVVWTEGWQGTL